MPHPLGVFAAPPVTLQRKRKKKKWGKRKKKKYRKKDAFRVLAGPALLVSLQKKRKGRKK
jgi:hypothetical protein